MKKITMILMAVLLMAGMASAQVGFSVGGGISKLMGDGSEHFNMGFNGRLAAFKPISDNMYVGVMGAYNYFGLDTDGLLGEMEDLPGVEYEVDASASIIEILPMLRYFLSPNMFIQAGGGIYMFKTKMSFSATYLGETFDESDDTTESKAGISLGAGFAFGKILIIPIYNMIFTENESTKYFTVNVMIGLN
ncbi:outer membrane beta-barrel protein [bacterium]|nr:outer membrane beta-barrel protein [bacterium]